MSSEWGADSQDANHSLWEAYTGGMMCVFLGVVSIF